MARPQPDREVVPAVQRLRVRYAKRGRLRFASHRDFQRAFERALRRAAVPMAYSAGFSPHPKVSYAGAAPTGAASEAEYLEIGVVERLDPDTVAKALDAALPPGLDVIEVVEARGGSLADRLTGASWRLELRGVDVATASAAVGQLLARDRVEVQRRTKSGIRSFDVRTAIAALTVQPAVEPTDAERPAAPGKGESHPPCAILHLVVRHQTPAVRPDDVLSALAQVDDLVPPQPPLVTRLAQGELDETTGSVLDPLIADRDGTGPTVGE
jgi:radical SAM-linked protein